MPIFIPVIIGLAAVSLISAGAFLGARNVAETVATKTVPGGTFDIFGSLFGGTTFGVPTIFLVGVIVMIVLVLLLRR